MTLHQVDTQLARREQAAQWLQRLREAVPAERVVEDWLEWCQRDALNQQAFDEMVEVWELSGAIGTPAVAAHGAIGHRAASPRRRALAAALTGIGLLAGAGGWWLLRSDAPALVTREYASPLGINSIQRLEDGSVLELGGGTRVSVTFGPAARRVQLHEGELFVTVRQQLDRPFSVEAGRLEVVATGTAFNVLRSEARTTVTVAEGSVKALYEDDGASTPNMRLLARQQLIYTHASHTVEVRVAEPREVIGWRSGTLYFQAEPLSEVIATVNRYTPRTLLIEDEGVGTLSFTGTARIDRLDGWLQGLPLAFPVTVAALPDGRQVIRPRRPTRSD